jgi:hypothetical protein
LLRFFHGLSCLQSMLCIFSRNQTKQSNPFNHSKPKPLYFFQKPNTANPCTNTANSENHLSWRRPSFRQQISHPWRDFSFLPCWATSLRHSIYYLCLSFL